MSEDLFHALEAAVPDPEKALLEPADGGHVSYGEAFGCRPVSPTCSLRKASSPATGSPCRSTSPGRWSALYLATLRAGAVYLPLNTGYTPAEIAYFLGDAEAKLFVCRPERPGRPATVAADDAGVARARRSATTAAAR